ncbi:hypothetical protein Dimus_030885 [Dionaea muscipula]
MSSGLLISAHVVPKGKGFMIGIRHGKDATYDADPSHPIKTGKSYWRMDWLLAKIYSFNRNGQLVLQFYMGLWLISWFTDAAYITRVAIANIAMLQTNLLFL